MLHINKLLVTGPRRIKNGDGYLISYSALSTGGAVVLSFREGTMTGTEIWRDGTPATTGECAKSILPLPGLRFEDALYVTGSNWPASIHVIYQ